MQICTLLQTDNHASSPPLSFLQAGCPSCHPTNSVKALKANLSENSKLFRNSCTDMAGFWFEAFLDLLYTGFKEIRVPPKIRVLFSVTFSKT